MEQETNLIVTKSLIGQAEELANEHEQFNEQYVVNGRKALYSLLEKIFLLAQQFEASPDKEDLYRLLRVEMKNKFKIKVQENTSNIALLVRYITRAERKTAHVYARAIESAMKHKMSSMPLSDYIEARGGIDKIRAEGVNTTPKQDEYIRLSRDYLIARAEMPLASFDVPKSFKYVNNPDCEFELVVCRWVGAEYLVVGRLPATVANEQFMLKETSKILMSELPDLDDAKTKVGNFLKTADEKRADRLARKQAEERAIAIQQKIR